jgi:hypothetical protein
MASRRAHPSMATLGRSIDGRGGATDAETRKPILLARKAAFDLVFLSAAWGRFSARVFSATSMTSLVAGSS